MHGHPSFYMLGCFYYFWILVPWPSQPKGQKSINKSYTHLVRPVIFTGKMDEGGEYELEPYRFCSLGICVSGTNGMTSSYVKLWRKPVGFPSFSTCDARLLDAAGRNSEAIPHRFFSCQCWNMWEDSATDLVRKPENTHAYNRLGPGDLGLYCKSCNTNKEVH